MIIIEPKYRGNEHIGVNVAFLAIANEKYPNEKIVFYAEKEQLLNIKKAAQDKNVDLSNIEFKEIEPEPQRIPDILNILHCFNTISKLIKLAKETSTDKIISLSASRPFLYSLKLHLALNPNIKFTTIIHADLELIKTRPPVFPFGKFFYWIKWAFLFGNKNNLKYIILGDSIKENTLKIIPSIEPYITSVDHPYFFEEEYKYTPFQNETVSFASLGAARRVKNSNLFFKLAKNIENTKTSNNAIFSVIGYIRDKQLDSLADACNNLFVASKGEPIDRANFNALIKKVDYAVFFFDKNSYKLTASGTMCDCLSFCKPFISIKNDYFQYYFEKFGAMGYLADNYEQLEQKVTEILNSPPTEEYKIHLENIMKARKELSINNLKNSFEFF